MTDKRKRVFNQDQLVSPITSGVIQPANDATDDLGTSTKRYRNAYFSGTVTSDGQAVTGNIIPAADNTYTLGSSSDGWATAYTHKVTFNGTHTTSLANATPSQNTTISFPDPGATTANVVLDTGNSTINGNKTLSGQTNLNTATFSNSSQTSNTNGVVIKTNTSTPWDALYIQENTNGTSKRAGIAFGSNWEMLQDSANSGTKNWALINDNTGNHSIDINPSNDTVTMAGQAIVKSLLTGVTQINGAVILDATTSGQIFQVGTSGANYTITLPTVSSAYAGVIYTFCVVYVASGGNITIYTPTLNGLNGFAFNSGGLAVEYGKNQVQLSATTLAIGDRGIFRCDGYSWTAEVYTSSSSTQTWT